MRDYLAGLYQPNGDVLCAGDAMAWHVGCAAVAVRRIIERFTDEGGIFPDDMFLINDPYLAAIHQPDMYVVSPIHVDERLIGWSATFVHVADVGAMSPGGNSPGATEICHEGIRIPGIKLIERGKIRRDVFDTITNMTRQPVKVKLDFKCHLQDGAGAGKFRGGAGEESLLMTHDAPEAKIQIVALGVAGLRNSGFGIYGGHPGAPSILVQVEDSDVRKAVAAKTLPDELAEAGGTHNLLGYRDLRLNADDLLYLRCANGGGYGDPLERDPEDVLLDVADGLVSRGAAESVYGVVLADGQGVDADATREKRDMLRSERQAAVTHAPAVSEAPVREPTPFNTPSRSPWMCAPWTAARGSAAPTAATSCARATGTGATPAPWATPRPARPARSWTCSPASTCSSAGTARPAACCSSRKW
ncbi:MAG: hydantoinase B/oxoprolinase family protein [Deltaproteobacteria bacterium]|nr:hydantoinase B/oxoprolinase family protein [Deltaproteobacteria bacterium]